jgi:hypothetical protein
MPQPYRIPPLDLHKENAEKVSEDIRTKLEEVEDKAFVQEIEDALERLSKELAIA